jgi:hypothetical protein
MLECSFQALFCSQTINQGCYDQNSLPSDSLPVVTSLHLAQIWMTIAIDDGFAVLGRWSQAPFTFWREQDCEKEDRRSE